MTQVEDGSRGGSRYADVTVRLSDGSKEQEETNIAFEVFITGEAKEIRGLCAQTPQTLDSLKARARQALGEEALKSVTFNLISQYVVSLTSGRQSARDRGSIARAQDRRLETKSESNINTVDITAASLKNGWRLEAEAERPVPRKPAKSRGRKPQTPLLQQVENAYAHLHDLDWLQSCKLAQLLAVRERVNPRHPMPEALALRSLLVEAAGQAMEHLEQIPAYAPIKLVHGEIPAG